MRCGAFCVLERDLLKGLPWFYLDRSVIGVGVGMLAMGAYKATKVDHMCSGSLENGSWKIDHQTVKFDKKNAITHNSMLLCDAGGILTPILFMQQQKNLRGKLFRIIMQK